MPTWSSSRSSVRNVLMSKSLRFPRDFRQVLISLVYSPSTRNIVCKSIKFMAFHQLFSVKNMLILMHPLSHLSAFSNHKKSHSCFDHEWGPVLPSHPSLTSLTSRTSPTSPTSPTSHTRYTSPTSLQRISFQSSKKNEEKSESKSIKKSNPKESGQW